jgi:hypothetical protein
MDRIGKRLQARAGNRWVRNTTENTFGFRTIVCPHCRRFNTYGPLDNAPPQNGPFRDPFDMWNPPTHCHACNGRLDAPEVGQ